MNESTNWFTRQIVIWRLRQASFSATSCFPPCRNRKLRLSSKIPVFQNDLIRSIFEHPRYYTQKFHFIQRFSRFTVVQYFYILSDFFMCIIEDFTLYRCLCSCFVRYLLRLFLPQLLLSKIRLSYNNRSKNGVLRSANAPLIRDLTTFFIESEVCKS